MHAENEVDEEGEDVQRKNKNWPNFFCESYHSEGD